MATKKQEQYGNSSISMLKGEDRVRKRPAVIFGSDGLDGCEHSVFEIISNSIDEAREGFGQKITVTKYADNILQFQASVVSSKSLTLNVSQVCDDFKVDCLGYKKTSGGGLLQVVDGAKPLFALGFMVKGDRNKAKKVFLKCQATGFTDDNNATDTDAGPTFADDSVSIVAYPTKSGTSNVISYSTVEGNSDYDDLFSTTLTVPTAA